MVSRVKYIIPKKGERVSDAHVRRLYVQEDDRERPDSGFTVIQMEVL
jgi:hypothetical protein